MYIIIRILQMVVAESTFNRTRLQNFEKNEYNNSNYDTISFMYK